MQELTYVSPKVLEWREVPEPTIQDARDALVKPVSVATCDMDAAIVRGRTPLKGPFPLGHEFIARVVALGGAVNHVKVGDLVVVPHHIACGSCATCARGLTANCLSVPPLATYGLGGRGGEWGGALADLVRVPFADYMLVATPAGVSLANLASVSENIPCAWSAVAPHLERSPNASVLVVGGGGGGSIGLYAVAIAKSLKASRVDYVDKRPERLERAQALGANVIEGIPAERLGPYEITVECSSLQAGLLCAVRSTSIGGVCTSTSLFFEEIALPLFDMYNGSIQFRTGRPNARTYIPDVLAFIAAGHLEPERLTFHTASWSEAIPALLECTKKLVISRDSV